MHKGHYVSLGDYSVTGIIQPPRITALQKRHGQESEPTFKSQIASFMGTGIHSYAERMIRLANVKYQCYEVERSIVVPYIIDPVKHDQLINKVYETDGQPNYRLITGKFDILFKTKKQNHLYDIKTANIWKVLFDPKHEDWHNQQNLYAWLLNERGVKLNSINILCFFKDWKQGEALRNKKLPQNQVVEYNLSMWKKKQQEDYLVDRMELHIAEEDTPDEDLPQCSREDRWERFPDGSSVQYAVLKSRTAKRATRVLGTMEDAISYARGAKGITSDSWIEIRYAKRTRCEEYCGINQFCNHYEAYCAKQETGTLNEYQSLKELI
jgi:hypothetical protein